MFFDNDSINMKNKCKPSASKKYCIIKWESWFFFQIHSKYHEWINVKIQLKKQNLPSIIFSYQHYLYIKYPFLFSIILPRGRWQNEKVVQTFSITFCNLYRRPLSFRFKRCIFNAKTYNCIMQQTLPIKAFSIK